MRGAALLNLLGSALWSLLSALARWAADRRLLRRERLPVRVISVGNIQVGGAGKTPLVALIARQASERGLTAAILCRGYGGEWETRGGVIAPDDRVDARACGDEAALLRDLAPRAWIGVGASRAASFREISVRARLDLVILDDGFQHHRLYRDLDIVAVTSAHQGQKLFRDHYRALERAGLVVWTKGESLPAQVHRFLRAPLVRVRYRIPSPAFPGRPVEFVSGLADGAAAKRSLEASGYRVVRHLEFPDHARYDEHMVQDIVMRAKEAGHMLVITGKDWVKWRELGISQGNVHVIEPEVVFETGEAEWERVVWGSIQSS